MGRLLLALGVVLALGAAWWLLDDGPAEAGDTFRHEAAQTDDRSMELTPVEADDDAPRALDVDAAPPPAGTPSATATPDSLPALEVRVHHADGAPAHVRGLLRVDDETVGDVTSGDAGLLSYPGRTGAAVLWLGGATFAPVVHALADAHGEHEVTLPAGDVLAGVVSVDDGPPPFPLLLRLRPGPEGVPGSLSRAFRTRIAGLFDSTTHHPIPTDAQGRFRVSGLPAGYTGRLYVAGEGLVLAPGHDDSVTAPDLDVHLALLSRPAIVGRIVHADGRVAAHAQLDVKSAEGPPHEQDEERSTGASWVTMPFPADAHGRFRVPFRAGDVTELTIRAQHEDGRLQWTGGPYPSGVSHDLGDLVLRPTRERAWRALAPDGSPVAGAVARVSGTRTWSEPADADGRGSLPRLPVDARQFDLVADRYERAAAPNPDGDEPVDVVLQPCTALDVALALPDGVSGDAVVLSLQTDGPLNLDDFADIGPDPRDRLHWRTGASEISWGGGVTRMRFAHGDAGPPWRLQCLHASRTVQLELRGRYGRLLDERAVLLAPGRWHDVTLSVPGTPADVELLVRDAAGRPVADCDISAKDADLSKADSNWWWEDGRTDGEGRLVLPGVWARRLELGIQVDGSNHHASVPVHVPPGGGTLTLTIPLGGDFSQGPPILR